MKKEILYWSLVIVSCLFMTFQASAAKAECTLVVDKKCFVEPAPFDCSSAKPINSITVIWYGLQEPVYVKAWNGSVDTGTPQTFGPISLGDEVTFTRSGEFPNDIDWEIYSDDGFANKIGESTFHLSCSDEDMNGPEDCGKVAGDGKAVAGYENWWIFEGMAGNGLVLDCTPAPVAGADACSFAAPAPADCEALGKPESLTFKYTGAGCEASDNGQAADKWACSGIPGLAPVSITIDKDPSKITVSPLTGVIIGDLVTVSAIGSDMGSEIQLYVGSQFLKIHTSCSQPLAVGDVFGSFELVKFNGQSGGADVTYTYTITNAGNTNVEVTSVSDDKLGELLESPPKTLIPNESFTLTKTAFISETTENTVTVSGQPDGSTSTCTATDSVTVTVGPLTLTIDIKPGSYPNSINPKSKGKIPVGILSTEEFDAPSQVDQDSLTFGRTGDEESLAFCNPWGEDINGDGLLDLVCHFYTQKAGFQCGDSEGFLKGMTTDDIPIEGTDSVRINPCK